MCMEDINNLSEKIYKATCEIEYLTELKKYIKEQETDKFMDYVQEQDNEEIKMMENTNVANIMLQKTKIINFKRAM